MTDRHELAKQLRALSRHEHDDLSIGDEAADYLEASALRVRELEADAWLLANAICAYTPDRNTQSPEEVAATEAEIREAAQRVTDNFHRRRQALEPKP